MEIPILTLEDIRRILNEELDKRFGPITSTRNQIISNPARDEEELIGTAEACKILGIGPRTMQRYRDRKCFSVVMRGPHKALYYRSEIVAFRDANTRSNRNNTK